MAKWIDNARKIEVWLGNQRTEYTRTCTKGVSAKLGKCELRYRLLRDGIEIISKYDVETMEGKRIWKDVRYEYHNVPFVIKKDTRNE